MSTTERDAKVKDDSEDEEGEEENVGGAAKKDNKKKKKKKGKTAAPAASTGPPISAAGKAILLRKQQQAEEEARLKLLQDEEDRKFREAQEKEEADRKALAEYKERKAKAKKEKIEAEKAAGVYMTKSEKEKAKFQQARMEAMKAAGMVPVAAAAGAAGAGEIKQSSLYSNNRKKKGGNNNNNNNNSSSSSSQKPAGGDDSSDDEAEAASSPAKPADAAAAEPAKESEPVATADDDDDDDWETAGDKIDEAVEKLAISVAAEQQEAQSAAAGVQDEEDQLAAEQRAEQERLRFLGEERLRREEEARKKREAEDAERELLERKAREAANKRATAHRNRARRHENAIASRTPEVLRSPICVIMGHVDTGKTKLLDKIRHTSVQEGEAGGITQQIGATQFPKETLQVQTASMQKSKHGLAFDIKVPGLLVIDTPGHEAFSNLRHRGSSLCDVAILVIDLMHGLEPQTIESINMLKAKRCPFVVALNKVDRCYGWKQMVVPSSGGPGSDIRPIQEAIELQDENCRAEFHDRTRNVITQLMEQGLNAALYWKNDDIRDTVSLVPTSAICGDGIPDLLRMLIVYSQQYHMDKIMFMRDFVQCTVLEVKVLDGIGHTVDVILVHGVLRVGDTIVVSTMEGPVVTTIKGLLTPPPNRESRVRSEFIHHDVISGATGLKIVANDLQKVIAGTGVLQVNAAEDDVEDVKEELHADLGNLMKALETDSKGVTVHASTLGALEALLQFLHHECKPPIPVGCINIGPIHKKDVMKAGLMHEKNLPEFATILAFDVKTDAEALSMSEEMNVKIFNADIIYHLFDQFSKYMEGLRATRRAEALSVAVFPSIIKIMPQHIFNKKDPIILGVEVVEGTLHVGTPLTIPTTGVDVGIVSSIQNNHKEVKTAKKGASVAIKIVAMNEATAVTYGRQFDHTYGLYSKLSRASIDSLKEHFKDDVSKEEWQLVIKMKKTFNIS